MSGPLPALFRRFPRLVDRLPWIPLGRFPTPVMSVQLDRDSADGARRFWVKRDDLSGTLYGGNKVRKLEFLLAEAQRCDAGRLITLGAAGSHHALATTVYARELGLPVTLLLFPQPLTEHVRRVLLTDVALGAEIRWLAHETLLPLALTTARWAHRHERPFVVPAGGSNRIGTLGYVSGALELAEQVEAGAAPRPDRIHVAGGTLGTAAGIALGLAIAGIDCRVIATRVVSPVITNRQRLLRLLAGAASVLQQEGVSVPDLDDVASLVQLDSEQLGAGYGHATAAGQSAAQHFLEHGVPLEPTYTAKAAAGMLAREFDADSVTLFWDTFSSVDPIVQDGSPTELPSGARRYLSRSS